MLVTFGWLLPHLPWLCSKKKLILLSWISHSEDATGFFHTKNHHVLYQNPMNKYSDNVYNWFFIGYGYMILYSK